MSVPFTGSMLSDLGIMALVFVVGMAIAWKAEQKWGYALVLASIGWGWMLIQKILHARH